MEKAINITVKDKIATAAKGAMYICGNSDFTAVFSFDAEWDAYDVKTARFKAGNGAYTDVIFSGNQCAIPIISNTNTIQVGVYAGNLATTTPAFVMAEKSILCGAGAPADPAPDVYNQLMDRLNEIETPSHDELTNRDAADQHPISAITGLEEALEAAGGGGGSTATPDWAENDETAAGYIANRTHWTDDDGTAHKLDSKYIPLSAYDTVGGIKVTAMPSEDLSETRYHDLIFRNELNDHLYTVRTDTIVYTELSPNNIKELINTSTLNTNALFTDSLGDDYSDTVLNRLQFPVHAWYYGTNYNHRGYPARVVFESADGLTIMAQIDRTTGMPNTLLTTVVESSEPPDLSEYAKAEDIQPGHMRINVTNDGPEFSADKTFAEIKAHIEAGGSVSVRVFKVLECPLVGISKDAGAIVGLSFGYSDGIATLGIVINDDDTVEMIERYLTAGDIGAIPAPSTAEVGQVVAVKAVDSNGKPTEWEPVDMAGGGKDLTTVADIDFSEDSQSTYNFTGLQSLTEIYLVGYCKSASETTASEFNIKINDIVIMSGGFTIQKAGSEITDGRNTRVSLLYNGAYWENMAMKAFAGSLTTQASASAVTTNCVVLNVGKAEKLTLYVPNSAFKPVEGWLKIYGR